MNVDKKAVNERRAALIAHVLECEVCLEWRDAQLHEAPHWFGRVGMPRPRTDACLNANRCHLEDVGMIPSAGHVKEMREMVSGLSG